MRAYRNALASGDMALARRAAGVLKRSGVAPIDVAILDLADAVRAGDRVAMDDLLGRIGAGPLDFLAPIVRAWIAQGRGADGVAMLDDATPSDLGRRYVAEHRALLLLASGQTAAGVAAIRAASALDRDSLDLRWNAATVLAARGQRQAALDLLAGDESQAVRLRAQLRRKGKPDVAFGTSRALTRLARDLAGQDAETLSIVLTRAALTLDPRDDRARLLLAQALDKDGARDRALAVLAEVRADSAFYDSAQTDRIRLVQASGQAVAALGLAAALAARPGATTAHRQLHADLLAEAGREAEAARVYADVLTQAGDAATWIDHLQLGGALERADQWEAALPHLRRAVQLGPDEAIALNYLGYSLVDRGQHLAEGLALLERASKLRPDDPAITDSLGWAYYRSGDYARALPLLERAAQGDPSSSTINEHLGDVYWKTGRRFEARYAWRAASLHAQDEQRARIAGKLADGLKGDAPTAHKATEVGRWVGAREQRRSAARTPIDRRAAAN